jgi:dTDP-4-dehydrorhamnose reductase
MARDFERILIVGKNGMLAGAIRRALEARGIAWTGLDHQACDITQEAQVRAAFEAHRPSLVFNCAAATNVDGCEADPAGADRLNGTAVGFLAEHARRHSARLVHYSTDFVFDGQRPGPWPVDAPTHPLSAYGRSKLLGERLLQEINPPNYLLLRTAWLYGVPGRCFPRTMVELARRPINPLKVVADQHGCPTHTEDLAEATLALIDRSACGLFHITNSGATTWLEFTQAILQEWNLPNEVLPLTSAQWQQIKPAAAPRPMTSAKGVFIT